MRPVLTWQIIHWWISHSALDVQRKSHPHLHCPWLGSTHVANYTTLQETAKAALEPPASHKSESETNQAPRHAPSAHPKNVFPSAYHKPCWTNMSSDSVGLHFCSSHRRAREGEGASVRLHTIRRRLLRSRAFHRNDCQVFLSGHSREINLCTGCGDRASSTRVHLLQSWLKDVHLADLPRYTILFGRHTHISRTFIISTRATCLYREKCWAASCGVFYRCLNFQK